MYTTHFMFPEQRWGVFKNNEFVTSFETFEDAETYIRNQQE